MPCREEVREEVPNESEDLLAGAIGAFVWGIDRTGRPSFLIRVACYLHPPRKCLCFSLLRRFHRAITFQDVYGGILAFDAIGREEFLNEVLPLVSGGTGVSANLSYQIATGGASS